MKKTIESLSVKLSDDNGRLKGGFAGIKGGRMSLMVKSNPNQCENTFVCQGTNEGNCTNSGDCSGSTNQGTSCSNTGKICAF